MAVSFSSCSFTFYASNIFYVIAILRGRAVDWALAYFHSYSVESTSFTSFLDQFHRTLKGSNTVKRLLNLKQDNQPVAEFIVEFRILAAETRWPTSMLQTTN